MASSVSRAARWAAGAALSSCSPLAYLALLLTQDRDAVHCHPGVDHADRRRVVRVCSWERRRVVRGRGAGIWPERRRSAGWRSRLIFLDVASLGAYQDLGEQNPAARFQQEPIAAFLASQPGPFRIDSRTQIDQPLAARHGAALWAGGRQRRRKPARASRFRALLAGAWLAFDRGVRLLNVRYVIAKKDVTLDWNKFGLAFDGDPDLNVYENTNAYLPRLFVAPEVYFEPIARSCSRRHRPRVSIPSQPPSSSWPDRPPAPVGGTRHRVRHSDRSQLAIFSRQCGCSGTGFCEPGVVSRMAGVVDGKYGGRTVPHELPVPGRRSPRGRACRRVVVRAGRLAGWGGCWPR